MQQILFAILIFFSPCFLAAKQPLAFQDNAVFLARCEELARDSELFAEFRRDPLFTLFAENVSEENGRKCLAILEKNYPELLAKLQKMQDVVGNPRKAAYGFSPTTVRYAKIVGDLTHEFGPLDKMRVLEIGSGYGGLCRTLTELASPKSYALCDFEQNLQLSLKFAGGAAEGVTLPQLPEGVFDLVVSDLAFSEMNASLQKRMIKEVFKYARRGFLICAPGHWKEIPFNSTEHMRVKPFARKELLRELARSGISYQTYSENPETGKGYYIVTWNNL